jgi:hypothetical protein
VLVRGGGIFLLIFGLLALVSGFVMDTTVPTGIDGDRVHNIGLMSHQQNTILLGVALVIVGAIFTAMGRRKVSQDLPGADAAPTAESRRCPFCAETIKAEALVCRFCNRDIDPVPTTQINLSHDELMAKYAISHDGSQYLFEQYRYDRLEDAVAYARRNDH